MAEYLFSSGSCLKKDLFDTIINLFKANGWTDISSNERLDYFILSSPSESGGRNLVLQIRPHTGVATADVRYTDSHLAYYRLIESYTPATNIIAGVYDVTIGTATVTIDGTAVAYSASANGTTTWKTSEQFANCINLNAALGIKYTAAVVDATKVRLTQRATYESPVAPVVTGTGASMLTTTEGTSSVGSTPRSSETWKLWTLEPASSTTLINKDLVTINYKYNVNANRLILVLEFPGETGYGPMLFYVGLPDEVYSAEGGSTGLLFAASSANPTAGTINVTNNPSEYTAAAASIAESCLYSLAPKNPNAAGKYILSEISYGGTLSGVRGKLTGIFVLPNQNILHGDIIQEGAKQFQVVVCHSYSSTAFPTSAFAIQIA